MNIQIEDLKFFDFLKKEDIDRLKEISIKKRYNKDEILFYKGDKPRYLHFLLKGIVKLYTHDYKGNEILLHNLISPSFIAEIVNYEEIDFLANCSFETNSEVLLIDYEKFKSEFLYKPEVSIYFIKSLTKKLKILESFINRNITSNSIEKIARFLYENEDSLKDLKQVKIAQLLNMAPETFSRKLAKFKKEGIIDNNKGKIEILDFDLLKYYIQE